MSKAARTIAISDPRSVQRSDTAEKILDLAEMLMQTRGYSAFSYQDISDLLGIRKASIHYHFESKTDLGVAVIDRYTDRFGRTLSEIGGNRLSPSMVMLNHYIAPYTDFADTPDRVCLCGALAGEILALPLEMRDRVNRFFTTHQLWLEGILKRGVARGEFKLSVSARKTARMIFGALQGALLVKRTTGDVSHMKDVISALKSQLT
jgi:TetR/AcrR family transcriptional regulator, transcriptional repressor for nem operon